MLLPSDFTTSPRGKYKPVLLICYREEKKGMRGGGGESKEREGREGGGRREKRRNTHTI